MNSAISMADSLPLIFPSNLCNSARLGGRKRKLDDKQIEAIRTLWDSNRHSKQDIGARFGVSKSTVDRIVRPEPIKKRNPVGVVKAKTKAAIRLREGE